MTYEDLLIESEKEDLIVKEKNIPGLRWPDLSEPDRDPQAARHSEGKSLRPGRRAWSPLHKHRRHSGPVRSGRQKAGAPCQALGLQ